MGTDCDDNGICFDQDECMESENDFEDDPEVKVSSDPLPKPKAGLPGL